MIVLASMRAPYPRKDGIRTRFEERRNLLEQARTARIRRIKQDIERIAKREVEFSRSLVHDLVPFRLVWNEEAIAKIKEYVPFTIEEKEVYEEDNN